MLALLVDVCLHQCHRMMVWLLHECTKGAQKACIQRSLPPSHDESFQVIHLEKHRLLPQLLGQSTLHYEVLQVLSACFAQSLAAF